MGEITQAATTPATDRARATATIGPTACDTHTAAASDWPRRSTDVPTAAAAKAANAAQSSVAPPQVVTWAGVTVSVGYRRRPTVRASTAAGNIAIRRTGGSASTGCMAATHSRQAAGASDTSSRALRARPTSDVGPAGARRRKARPKAIARPAVPPTRTARARPSAPLSPSVQARGPATTSG